MEMLKLTIEYFLFRLLLMMWVKVTVASKKNLLHIARVPSILRGSPVVRGTRIPVWQIANAIIHFDETITSYQADHPSLSLAQIHAALSYYFDHRAEIEKEIESNQLKEAQDKLNLIVDERGFIGFAS